VLFDFPHVQPLPLPRRRCARHRDGEIRPRRTGCRVGAAAAGQVERGAVIDRGADDGQAERDVDAVLEGGVLEHRQALVVVHREHGVGRPARCAATACRPAAGRRGPCLRRAAFEHRRDDLDLLAAHVPAFAGMRVEPGHQDARPRDAELAAQVGVQDAQRAFPVRSA
jgi:hypothetical protein